MGGMGELVEGLSEPNRWQRFERNRGGSRRRDLRHVEYRRGRFGEIGEIARASDRIFAPGHGGLALDTHGRNFVLDDALFEGGPRAADLLDLLRSTPGRVTERPGQVLEPPAATRRTRALCHMRCH